MAQLTPAESREFLQSLGLEETGLDRLIKAAFNTLDLITYITTGEIETRAWTIKKGTHAQEAAGKIHTDIQKGFIRAEVVPYEVMMHYKGRVGRQRGRKSTIRRKRIHRQRWRRRSFLPQLRNYNDFCHMPQGIEQLLVDELKELGVIDARKGFAGSMPLEEMDYVYKINYCSRLATRVLYPLNQSPAKIERTLYENAKRIPWQQFLNLKKTFAIDSNVSSSDLRNSHFTPPGDERWYLRLISGKMRRAAL